MTKKDFKLIAEVFKWDGWNTDKGRAVSKFDIADALALDNPRFDREKFLAACEGVK